MVKYPIWVQKKSADGVQGAQGPLM